LVIINLIKLPKILFKNARICIVIQDHQQNRILVIHPTPPKKKSSKSADKFSSYPADRHTNAKT